MVESEAELLSEDQMLGAVVFGHDQQQVVIQNINDLVKEAGKTTLGLAARSGKRRAERTRCCTGRISSERRIPHHRQTGALCSG